MSPAPSAPAPTDSAPAVATLPVGGTLDRGFALLGRSPRSLLLPAVLLHLAPMVVAVVLAAIGMLLIGDVHTVPEQVRESTFFGDSTLETRDVAELTDRQTAIVVFFAVLAGFAYLWFSVASYAAVIRAARRTAVGADPLPLRAALRDALRQAPRLFGLALIALLVLGVAAFVAGLVLLGFYALSTAAAALAAIVIGLAVVYVVTRMLLLPVVAVVEGRGVDAFRRTWTLTAGRFWPLLGLAALLAVVVVAVDVVVTLVLEAAFGVLNALDSTVGTWALIPYAGLSVVAGVVFAAACLAPLVVAHRSLSGDEADPREPAGGPPSTGGSDAAGRGAADGPVGGADDSALGAPDRSA